MTTAATIYMSLLGPEGLETVASNSHANTQLLKQKLTALDGVEGVFSRPEFHEAVLRLNTPVTNLIDQLSQIGILPGYNLSEDYPELGNALLICATETKTEQDLDHFAAELKKVIS